MSAPGIVQLLVVVGLAASLVVKVRAQRRQGIRAIVLGRADDGLVSRLEPVAVLAMFLWFAAVAIHGTGWAPQLFEPRLFRSPAAAALGAILALAGLGLVLTSLWQMGRSWRIGIDPGSRDRLVTSGVFSISRNPIYLALALIGIGVMLMSGSVFFLVTGFVLLAGLHLQILREERFLSSAFGEEYDRYRRRVARYLGRCG